MPRTILVVLLFASALLAACQPQEVVLEVTRVVKNEVNVEVTRVVSETVVQEATSVVTREVERVVEITREPLGTTTRPVNLLFPPRFDSDLIMQRGAPLAEMLSEATGYQFRVGILDNEQAVIDLMCAAPTDTIGILSPGGYVLAHEQCNVQAGSIAVGEDGLPTTMGMLVARADSGLETLEDLAGASWAVPEEKSLSSNLYFQALLEDESVDIGESVPMAGESVAMLAVLNEEVDVASAEFIPPILPYEERMWDPETDDPEPWRALGLSPQRSPIGYVLFNGEPEFGGYRLRDARSRVFDVEPDIYDETLIVALSEPLPNETIAFGRDFPLALARQVGQELTNFIAEDACGLSLCSPDFYNWHGLSPARDEMYDPIRFVQETLDLQGSDLLALEP